MTAQDNINDQLKTLLHDLTVASDKFMAEADATRAKLVEFQGKIDKSNTAMQNTLKNINHLKSQLEADIDDLIIDQVNAITEDNA